MITIRPATDEDLGQIVYMASKFYATTSYANFAHFNSASVSALADLLVKTGIMLLAEFDGIAVGMVGLLVVPFPFNNDVKTAHEIVWYVDPDAQGQGAGKALLAAIEPACRDAGAVMIQMLHLSTSPPQAAAIYERMGYALSESSYAKELI